ncbi:hypothetical protein BDY21DRAFT_371135 [Lineolata rhizophorae]|uniref:Myb-like domain-containing protein n=1 Tax=Lineolata rhizophorae TaxID=578093 RepID=A0A6A6P2N2_9PEZI|nr:hypothetical protein BDY21DRAFT_371135 [Lineolata rhizophorae]
MNQIAPSPAIPALREIDHHANSALRARKMASTGGNRSWSEEEENYLLQTRMQKMPYKHIAAHLKKTELACRLHYHQLSHGSHRRKRTSSVSSSNSSESTRQSPNCPRYHLDCSPEEFSSSPRHGSPATSYSPNSPRSRSSTINSSSASPHARFHHKVLLPKPQPQPQPQQLRPHTTSPEPLNALRINTSDAALRPAPAPMANSAISSATSGYPSSVPSAASSIDTDRLRAIYDARRSAFWASIAAEYGPDASPAQLEELWRQSQGGSIPAPPSALPHPQQQHPQPPLALHTQFQHQLPHLGHPGPSPIGGARPPTPGPSPDGSVTSYPALKPSPFPPFNPQPPQHHQHQHQHQAHQRPSFVLPTPIASAGAVPARRETWSSGSGATSAHPATTIAALLTEDRCPRPERIGEDVPMRDAQ